MHQFRFETRNVDVVISTVLAPGLLEVAKAFVVVSLTIFPETLDGVTVIRLTAVTPAFFSWSRPSSSDLCSPAAVPYEPSTAWEL